MRDPAPPPLPGDRLGPYRLVEAIGVGGMAAVYRADGPDGPAAIKILHQSRITAEEVKRFRREYVTLERLRHRHVVRVYGIGEQNGYPWIAMEYIDGPDLGTLLDRWKNDPPPDRFERVTTIFAALCDALAYVHEQGIVHRDLKPGNVLVGSDGLPRLTDFGVVKDPDAFPTSLTVAGRLVGTVAFMAPEQITGESPDARADLYSLGALLYMMLTWRRPIVADSIAGYLTRHLTETPKPPSDWEPRVPQRLEQICMRLLQKDPARRYPSARQVIAALVEEAPAAALPLHGRDAELDLLLGRVQVLLKRRVGGVVAITGSHGSGKSRVLAEIVERARLAGLSTASAGPTDTLAVLEASLPPGGTHADTTLARIRARLGDCPWLLAIDDLDDAPPEAEETLAALVRDIVAIEGGPLLFVATAENTLGSGILTGASTGLGIEEVPLGGVDRDAIRAVLRDRGVHGATGAALGRRLHEDLGGNVGATLEQVEALVRAGWLVRSADGSVRSTRPVDALRVDPLPLPDRVRQAEASFLERLPTHERDALEALAVLGGPSSVSLIAPMVGIPEPALTAALFSLARAGHAVATEDGLQELFHVASRLRAQVIYEDIRPDRRIALHRAAADALQRLHKRRVGTVAESASYHLLHAGDPGGAYPLLILAAQRALRRADLATTRIFAQRALEARAVAEATLPPAEAAKLRRQLHQVVGDASRAQGQLDAAADAYAEALAAAHVEGDRAAAGKALAGIGLVALARGRVREAIPALTEAVGSLEQGDASWPEATGALALARFDAGDRAEAEHLWRASVEFGGAARNLGAEIGGLWGLALVARAEGRRADAVATLEQAAGRGRGQPVPDVLVRVHHERGELLLEDGDWAGAARLADEADELGDRATLPVASALAAGLRAAAARGLDDAASSVRAAREAIGLCRLHQIGVLGVWAHAIRALAGLADLDEVAPRLQECGWSPTLPYDGEALRLSLLALCLTGSRPDAARDAATAALARPVAVVPGAAARVELDAGRVLLRSGDRAGAGRAAERALMRLDDRNHRALVAEACRLALEIAPSPAIAARLKRVGERL